MSISLFFLFILLGINIAISVWNCFAVGTVIKDVMAFGGKFQKALVWSAIIQSTIGFSMPIVLLLGYALFTYATGGTDPMLTPEQGATLWQGILSLWWILIIIPGVGSCFIILGHSLWAAYKYRDFASIAVAGWNTVATINNVMSMINNFGGALSHVGELFKIPNHANGVMKIWLYAFVIVIIALIAGFAIAVFLVRFFSRHTTARFDREWTGEEEQGKDAYAR